MSRINSRQELKNYILRALGHPVLNVNVDDEQVEDRIDDALDLFQEYHGDGAELIFLHHQVTQQEIDDETIILPDDVISIVSVLSPFSPGYGSGANGIAQVNLQYQSYMTDLMNPMRVLQGGLSNFYIMQMSLGTMADTFASAPRLTFNKHHDRLSFLTDWGLLSAGDWIAIECYRAIDPDSVGSVYGNRWLKKYSTALVKYQWGMNLIKFGGALLPGSISVNAEQILEEAKAELEKLQNELENNYQLPVDFFMG